MTNLLATWVKVHHQQTAPEEPPLEESRGMDNDSEPEKGQSADVSISDWEAECAESSESASDAGSGEEDIVKDFYLSSSEDSD